MLGLNCPNCQTDLTLALVMATGPGGQTGKERLHRFTIQGRTFELTLEDVVAAADRAHQPIYDSYVEIPNGSGSVAQYPTKDLLRQAIRRKYPESNPVFQSQRAEDILRKIGFRPKRKLVRP